MDDIKSNLYQPIIVGCWQHYRAQNRAQRRRQTYAEL